MSQFKAWIQLAVAVGVSLCVLMAPRVGWGQSGEWSPGVYLAQALGKVHRMAEIVPGYGYDQNVSLMAAWVAPGEQVSFVRSLRGGESYAFLAAGDDDAIDVDFELYDQRGRLVQRDNGIESVAAVVHAPRTHQRHTLRLRLVRSRGNQYSLCALAILSNRGWDIPQDNLIRAVVNLVAFGTGVAQEFPSQFLVQPNQWAVYGGVLSGGQSTSIENVRLGSGPRAILASADTERGDIDLRLLDAGGEVLAVDNGLSADALVYGNTRAGENYRIRMTNAVNSPRFVLSGIFSVETGRQAGRARRTPSRQPLQTVVY